MSYKYLKNENLRNLDVIKEKFGENSFEYSAIDFIRNKCTDLRFDKNKENEEDDPKSYTGKCTEVGQIPYNMEKDIDRYTLENSIINFLYSGMKEDAYNIFYCFLEMFIGDYNRTESMVELLSEYESNGSRLLLKHRDHYSHSAFVFILGLAIYNSNEEFKNTYNEFYKVKGNEAANHFLEYWGLTSLFHDIGYPFELPFEQLESYFEIDNHERKDAPFLSYSNLTNLIKIDKKIARKINDIYKDDQFAVFEDTNELFAYAITKRLASTYYFTKDQMTKILSKKPCNPDEYNYYMDHAYFSANLVFQKLFSKIDEDTKFTMEHIDAMTAIILHNSLYKFKITDYKDPDINIPLDPSLHPLAYMLMICDELQCWDRTAYGRMSSREIHPLDVNIELKDNNINASYIFDVKKNEYEINEYEKKYNVFFKTKPNDDIKKWYKDRPKLKSYGDYFEADFDEKKKDIRVGISKFQGDIERIVNTEKIKLNVSIEDKNSSIETIDSFHNFRTGYLSDSNFTNMNNFAEILNFAYDIKDENGVNEFINNGIDYETMEKINDKFKNLSLEYKIFNINKAKAFPGFLETINCFYTNKPVSNSEVDHFYDFEIDKISKLSHMRWLTEKYLMGWRYGEIKGNNDEEKKIYKYKNRIHDELIKDYDFNVLDDIYGSNRKNFVKKAKENFDRLNKESNGNFYKRELIHTTLIIPLLKYYEGTIIYCLKKRGDTGYIEDEDEWIG